MFQELRASFGILILFTLVTGLLYPLAVSGVGQALFPYQAGGSLTQKDGTIIGSELIGQNFTDAKYFHPRPSAAGTGYDASNSSGSNLAPTAPDLIKTITARAADLRPAGDTGAIPVDLVTASASGLDPDISVAAANFEAGRVAEARGLPLAQIRSLIVHSTTPRSFGMLGEARVNVLALNRALDEIAAPATTTPSVTPLPETAPQTPLEAPPSTP